MLSVKTYFNRSNVCGGSRVVNLLPFSYFILYKTMVGQKLYYVYLKHNFRLLTWLFRYTHYFVKIEK